MTSNDNQYENCIDDTHMSEKEIWDVWKMNFILWAIILLFLININLTMAHYIVTIWT